MTRQFRVSGFTLLALCGFGLPAAGAPNSLRWTVDGRSYRVLAPAGGRERAVQAVGNGGGSGLGAPFMLCADSQRKSDQAQINHAGAGGPSTSSTVDWLSEEDLMPAGRSYPAEVPATLDLAERARISVEGLARFLDPRHHYSSFGHGWFCTNPPFMVHDQGASQNWGKVAEALVLTRRMSGSRAHLGIQLGSLGGMMDYAVAKSREPYPVPLARMLLALVALDRQHPSPELVARINQYKDAIIGGLHVDAERNQAFFGPADQRWHRADEENDLGITGYWIQVFTGGSVLRALVVAGQVEGVEVPRERLAQLKNYLMDARFWQPEQHSPLVIPAEHGQFWGHHHSYTQALLGLLYYAHFAGDERVKQFVRAGYEYLRTYGLARIGLFGEGCTVGDMTYLAVRLSRWGVGDYWEDVDQYARNHLAELQLTKTAAIQEIIDRHAPALATIHLEDWCQGVDTDDVLSRCRGIFMSDASSPTLIPLRRQHIPYRSRMQWVVCCTGNCTKALHEVFAAITEFDPPAQTAKVNLLLNRAAPWLDVSSYLPYEGRVVIKNKQAQRLLVRVPRWADKQAVRCTARGKRVRCAWVGNYALLVDLGPTAVVTVEFPLVETTETYTLAWQEGEFWQESTKPPYAWDWHTLRPQKYKIHLRGNTVLDIEPRDTQIGIPLYTDRSPEKLRGRAPLREVTRFVAGATR